MAYTYGDVDVDPVGHLKQSVAAHRAVHHKVSAHVEAEHVRREAEAKDRKAKAEMAKLLKT